MKRFLPLVLCLAFVLALLVFPVSGAVTEYVFDADFESQRFYYNLHEGDYDVFVDFVPADGNGFSEEFTNLSFYEGSCYDFPIDFFYGGSYVSCVQFYMEDGVVSVVFDAGDHCFVDPCLAVKAVPAGALVGSLPGEDGSVDTSGLMSSIVGGLSAFSTSNLIAIIGVVLGITVAPVLLWFGFNFAKRKLMGAMKKGRL